MLESVVRRSLLLDPAHHSLLLAILPLAPAALLPLYQFVTAYKLTTILPYP